MVVIRELKPKSNQYTMEEDPQLPTELFFLSTPLTCVFSLNQSLFIASPPITISSVDTFFPFQNCNAFFFPLLQHNASSILYCSSIFNQDILLKLLPHRIKYLTRNLNRKVYCIHPKKWRKISERASKDRKPEFFQAVIVEGQQGLNLGIFWELKRLTEKHKLSKSIRSLPYGHHISAVLWRTLLQSGLLDLDRINLHCKCCAVSSTLRNLGNGNPPVPLKSDSRYPAEIHFGIWNSNSHLQFGKKHRKNCKDELIYKNEQGGVAAFCNNLLLCQLCGCTCILGQIPTFLRSVAPIEYEPLITCSKIGDRSKYKNLIIDVYTHFGPNSYFSKICDYSPLIKFYMIGGLRTVPEGKRKSHIFICQISHFIAMSICLHNLLVKKKYNFLIFFMVSPEWELDAFFLGEATPKMKAGSQTSNSWESIYSRFACCYPFKFRNISSTFHFHGMNLFALSWLELALCRLLFPTRKTYPACSNSHVKITTSDVGIRRFSLPLMGQGHKKALLHCATALHWRTRKYGSDFFPLSIFQPQDHLRVQRVMLSVLKWSMLLWCESRVDSNQRW
ncbi:hypothetical protein VP01_300g1 [Puccinia sorghi]|uniref:Uncharacterized protein n=1 Tax=Puccinia sorghi TaxID=27349 RepID=A0A0L6V111_9BASI|nr:hypothetical protein VP01_300g1 [Puccinia sorghi]